MRLQHIGDARLELEDAAHPTSPSEARSTNRTVGWPVWLGGGALALAALAAGIAVSGWRRAEAPEASLQLAIVPAPETTFSTASGGGTGIAPQFAVSPDGSGVVFVAEGETGFQLWYRALNAADPRALPGTDNASFPFWSPDNRSVGFFADAKLKRIRIDGGPPLILADATSARGGTWNRNDVILFAPSTQDPLQRISASGGMPRDISTLDAEYGETSHRFPFFLPDGKHFLYTAAVGACCPAVKPGKIKIGVLDATDTETIAQVESSVSYADGHLLYADAASGTLMARPFDADRRKFLGDAFAIPAGVSTEGSRYASISASSNGILVFARGVSRLTTRLTWFDRAGRQLGTVGEAGAISQIALAPDDRQVAVSSVDLRNFNRDVWVLDSIKKTQTRVSFDPNGDESPIWFRDQRRLLFVGRRPGRWMILQKTIGDATNEEPVLNQEGEFRRGLFVNDVAADGTVLFQQTPASVGPTDIWMLRQGEATPSPVVQNSGYDSDAAFSPDGKWIAYQTNEAGQRPQVYVQPFPARGSKFQVSRVLGMKPLWRSDGKELFFLTDTALMAVDIDAVNNFEFGEPKQLFTVAAYGRALNGGRVYGVARDGQRFLVNTPVQQSRPQALTVLTNWLTATQR